VTGNNADLTIGRPLRPVLRRRALLAGALAALATPARAARFADELDAFAEADRRARSPAGAILFVGSSTIRLWTTLAGDFAPVPVVRRGFGGATLAEVIDHRRRLFRPHRPAAVVLYAGENDVAEGASPTTVVRRYAVLRARLADSAAGTAPWVFIGLKPSPARWHLWPAMREVNTRIRSGNGPAPAGFVETAALVLDGAGSLDRGLFLPDGLHFNDMGYRGLAAAVRAALDQLNVFR